MNILPKKRWHVKNKDNAAKVESDESLFKQKKKSELVRSLVATQEARSDYLRMKSKDKMLDLVSINKTKSSMRLFAELEENRDSFAPNIEFEADKKSEREKQEKKLGILKYLCDEDDVSKINKPWWLSVPSHEDKTNSHLNLDEIDAKKKYQLDPLLSMKKVEEKFFSIREMKHTMERQKRSTAIHCVSNYPSIFPDDIKTPMKNQGTVTHGEKEKSLVNDASSIDLLSSKQTTACDIKGIASMSENIPKQINSIEKMRSDRLARERVERERAAVVLCKSLGLTQSIEQPITKEPIDERQLPFNAAFNPELSNLAAERRHQYQSAQKRRRQ